MLGIPTPTPAVDPRAADAWVLDLATASAGVLNVRRLGVVVVRHLVPLVATAAALVVVADGEVTVVGGDGAAPQTSQHPVRRLGREARAALEWLSGVPRALAATEAAAVGALLPVELAEQVWVLPLPLAVDGAAAGLLVGGAADLPAPVAPLLGGHVDAALRFARRSALASLLSEAYRPRLGAVPGLDVASCYRPSREEEGIGGDFVDLVDHGDGDRTVVVGDVNGHGSDAAVVTGQVRQALRAAAQLARAPHRQLALADAVMQREQTSRFATAVTARLTARPDGRVRLALARAGHPPALLIRRSGDVEVLGPAGAMLGALPSPSWDVVTRVLRPGDVLVMYTDGVTDARGPRGLFGLRRLTTCLRDFAGVPAEGVVAHVEERVVQHCAGQPRDDIAVVAVRIPEEPA